MPNVNLLIKSRQMLPQRAQVENQLPSDVVTFYAKYLNNNVKSVAVT